MEAVVVAVIDGLFIVVSVYIAARLTARATIGRDAQKAAFTLAEVAASMSRVEGNQKDLWAVTDGLRSDVAYMAGNLGIQLPPHR